MTESEWMDFDLPVRYLPTLFNTTARWIGPPDVPRRMAARLRELGTIRQLFLFGCACCRRIWPLLEDRGRSTIELIERYDGTPPIDALRQCLQETDFVPDCGWSDLSERIAARAVLGFIAGVTAHHTAFAVADRVAERKAQYPLFQDIYGCPEDAPKVDPSWLAFQDGAVASLAEAIHREKSFRDIPVLADSLIDAGCSDERILSHLQNGGPHVMGCWVIDLLRSHKG